MNWDADIVHDPHFESAVVKIQDEQFNLFARDEQQAVGSLLEVDSNSPESVSEVVLQTLTFADQELKKRKVIVDHLSKWTFDLFCPL